MTALTPSLAELSTHFAQVVVPVDFSPLSWRALTEAGRVARAFGVPLRVVHVDTASPWLDEGVHQLVPRDAPNGQPVEVTVVAATTPTDGILRVLGDDESSLLVMSTHGHTAATELATGSVAEALLRRWQGPMLLAGTRFRAAPVPFRRIVVCVDPRLTAVSESLAQDVLAWASVFQVPVEVLSVVEPEPAADFESILRENERIQAAADAVSTNEHVARLVRLEGNRPAKDIARYADAVDGTLVALPTHARTPSARFVLGSTAVSILRHTASPVLVRRFPKR
jgi:nucleotide-binding universal stress UspA family protein